MNPNGPRHLLARSAAGVQARRWVFLPPEEGDRLQWHPSSARPRCNPQAKSPGGEGFPLGLVRAASRKPRNHPQGGHIMARKQQPRAAARRDHRRERDRQEPELRKLPLAHPGTRCRGARPQVHRRRKAVLDLTLATTAAGSPPPYGRLWGARPRPWPSTAGKGRELYVDGRLGSRVREVEATHQAGDLAGRELPTLVRPLTASADTGESPPWRAA